MKLLIDAGNTRIKWALVNGMTRRAQASGAGMPFPRLLPQSAGHAITSDSARVVGSPSRMASGFISNVSEADGEDWVCRGDLPTGHAAGLSQDITAQLGHRDPKANLHDIKEIWVSNVAGETVAQLIQSFGAGISTQPHIVVPTEAQCGVRNGYSSTSQLGSDRWAALISAWHMVKGQCLVVNSGTATTIDALSGQGEFVGGLILPGVELMQHSLVEAADQLKSAQGEYVPFPLNSADALYSGAIQASCGAIERQYALLNNDSAPMILSGGTAVILQPYFNQKLFKEPPRFVDNLVLRGLLVMAQEADCS
jgi:type III pantothenate kinase